MYIPFVKTLLLITTFFTMQYSSEQLHLLKKESSNERLPTPVWNVIKSCNLHVSPATHRGVRAGTRKQKFTSAAPQLHQATLSNNQFPSDSSTRHQCKPTVKQTNLHLTFWNVRSLCNKATEVGDYITEQNIDLLAITETWLKDTNSHVINECTPTGYSICHTPRITSSGGGVALVYKSSMKLSSWKPLKFQLL